MSIIRWIYTTIFDMVSICCIVLELTWCQFFVSSECKSFSRRKKFDPIHQKTDMMLFFFFCVVLFLDDAKVWRCRQFFDPVLKM